MGIFGGGDEDEIARLRARHKREQKKKDDAVLKAFRDAEKARKRREKIARDNAKKKK